MKTFHLQIAAPDGLRYDGEASQISVRGIEGDLAVLAGHIPFATALRAGECRVYDADGAVRRAAYTGDMIHVADGVVRMISADFRWSDESAAE